MKRSLIVLAVALAFGSGAVMAQEQTPTPQVGAAERAQFKAEKEAKKAAKAKTAEEQKAAKAQRQQELSEILKRCDNNVSVQNPTAEQRAQLKADAAAAKEARAKMTAAERKALSAEKKKIMTECLKYGG